MPQRAATIESLPAAFEVVKAMQAQGLDWGEGYRPLGRRALAEIIETEMAAAVDRWLAPAAVAYWKSGIDSSAVRKRLEPRCSTGRNRAVSERTESSEGFPNRLSSD